MVFACRVNQNSRVHAGKESSLQAVSTGTFGTEVPPTAYQYQKNIVQVNCESYTLLGLDYQFNYSFEHGDHLLNSQFRFKWIIAILSRSRSLTHTHTHTHTLFLISWSMGGAVNDFPEALDIELSSFAVLWNITSSVASYVDFM